MVSEGKYLHSLLYTFTAKLLLLSGKNAASFYKGLIFV